MGDLPPDTWGSCRARLWRSPWRWSRWLRQHRPWRSASWARPSSSFSPAGEAPSGGTSTLTIRLFDADKLDALDSIAFSDVFPQGMTLVSAAASQCSFNAKACGRRAHVHKRGRINVGQACSITAVVSATGPPGLLVNTTSIFDYNDVDVLKTEPATSGTLTILNGRAPAITSGPPPDGSGCPTTSGHRRRNRAGRGHGERSAPGTHPRPSTLQITGTPTAVG